MDHPTAGTGLKEAIEAHEFPMGVEAGRLAVMLNLLADALVLAGQHGANCQSARQPGRGWMRRG